MAEVFRARMTGDGSAEHVALKRVHAHLLREPQARALFEREATLSAALHHPNIVGVRAIGEDEHGPYLALELVEGAPLSAVVAGLRARDRVAPLAAALSIALDLAN